MTPQFRQIWETIAEDLKRAIIRGELRPKQRLKIEELTAKYGVSNTPVREAFRYMASLGFVENIPRRMVVVKEISLKEIEDIYAIQTVLEGLAAGLAAKHRSKRELERLEKVLKQLEGALIEKNIEKYMKVDVAFHQALVDFSNNERLGFLLENTRDQIVRFRNIMLRTPGRMAESMREHRKIFAAVKSRDTERADLGMREQNQASLCLLREILKNRRGSSPDEASGRAAGPDAKDDFSGQEASIANDND